MGSYLYEDFTCGPCTESGYFQSGLQCLKCDSNCQECQSTRTHCTVCPPNKFMYPSSTCGSCLEAGHYVDLVNQACPFCLPTCATCTSPDYCITCLPSLYLDLNSGCVTCNEDRRYKIDGFCHSCHSTCLTCNGSLDTNCLSCPLDRYLISETGECKLKESIIVESSSFSIDMKQVLINFDTAVQSAAGATVEQDAEIMIYSTSDKSVVFNTVNTSSLSVPLKDISKLGPIDSFKVVSIELKGNILKIKLDFTSSIKAATFVIRFKSPALIHQIGNKRKVLIEQQIVVSPVDFIMTSLDAALQQAQAPVQTTVSTVTTAFFLLSIPQAFLLMKVFQTVDYYIYIDCDYPINFSKFLDIISKDVMDYLPNILERFADDDGDPLYPRFEAFGLNVHIFKNLGRIFTLVSGLLAIKLLAWLLFKSLNSIPKVAKYPKSKKR